MENVPQGNIKNDKNIYGALYPTAASATMTLLRLSTHH